MRLQYQHLIMIWLQIKQRYEKLAEERRKAAELDRLRLEEIQRLHAEQAAIDAERSASLSYYFKFINFLL